MRLFSFCLLFSLGTLLLVATAPSEAPAATFADGMLHVIDASNGIPLEGLDIADDPNGVPTTVVVISGGVVLSRSTVRDHSRLVISGGVISGPIELTDNAELLLEAGQIRDLVAGGSSVTSMFGGRITGQLRSRDQASVTISGGTGPTRLLVAGQSEVSILGFDFQLPLGELGAFAGRIVAIRQDGNELVTPFGRAPDARIFLVERPLLDADGDSFGDGVDSCPFFASEAQLDTNADGRGDVCQCGDGNGDGDITEDDLNAVVMCSIGLEHCDSTIVDADGDGVTTALDIGGVSAVSNGVIPTLALTCVRAAP